MKPGHYLKTSEVGLIIIAGIFQIPRKNVKTLNENEN